jgi:dTDP-glucose 4,6-dehydratase
MTLRALNFDEWGEKLPLYGDGKNVRDWIHVEDHCAALDCVLRRGREGEVYNVGGRAERENLAIVREILRLCGRDESLIERVPDRLGHDRRYAIDGSKIERELGFVPTRRLEEGLAETVEWYRANRAWWQGVRSGEYRAWVELNYARRQTGSGGGA